MSVGRWESLGVLMLSTHSYENSIIPAGVSPAVASNFGLSNNANGNVSSDATA